MPRFLDVTNLGLARTALGATATGSSLFTAEDALAARTALGEDPYRVQRLEQIKAAATIWSNLVTDEHIHAGVKVPAAGRPVSVSAPSQVTPGGTNLLADMLPLTEPVTWAADPVPAGLSITTEAAPVTTVNGFDGDAVDITFQTEAGQVLTGDLRFGWTPATTGNYLFGCTVECLEATADPMALMMWTYRADGGAVSHYPKDFYISEERTARYIVTRVTIGNVLDKIRLRCRVFSDADIGTSARFVISGMMLVPETTPLPRHGGLLSAPRYSQGTVSAGDIALTVPASKAGQHMILVKTVERGWIASRGNLTSGSNNLSTVFSGASMTVREVLAVPVADWQLGDLDVIAPPRFRGVDFVYTNNVNADGYRRYFADAAMMTGSPAGRLLGVAGTPRPYATQVAEGRATLNRFTVFPGDNETNPPATLGTVNDRSEMIHGVSVQPDTETWISTWVKLDNAVEGFAILSQLKSLNLTLPGRYNPDFAFSASSGNKIGCGLRSNRNPTIAATGDGTTATITYANRGVIPQVGDEITITGMQPSGYNGTHTVTAASSSEPWTVSFASIQTGAQTTAGLVTVQFATSTPLVDYEIDRWHHSVMRVNFSRISGGSFAWWWDGQEVFNDTGEFGYLGLSPDPASVEPGDPFVVTQGIYRSYSQTPLTVDFQHFTVTTASLQSQIANPPPI